MSGEQEGTPEDFTAMFGGAEPDQESEADAGPEPVQPEPRAELTDAEQAARHILGDPEMAQFLKGDTVKELVDSAGRLAQAIADARAQEAFNQLPPVNFDGGARHQTPQPTDPERAHNELLADLFRDGGGNGEVFGGL